MPFWANSHTRFLADKVVPVIMGAGIKLMVLAFILSIAVPYIETHVAINTALDLNSAESVERMGSSMALAFLAWQAPSMAAGLMSGMGSTSSAASISQTTSGMGATSTMLGGTGGGSGFAKMMNSGSGTLAKAASYLNTSK